jgi:hypothetical protein
LQWHSSFSAIDFDNRFHVLFLLFVLLIWQSVFSAPRIDVADSDINATLLDVSIHWFHVLVFLFIILIFIFGQRPK